MPQQIAFAIDFDKTWTADPDFFNSFAELAGRARHTVTIVTRRSASEPINRPNNRIPFNVFILYCSEGFKRIEAERQGFKFDIWIDDEPGTIEPQRLPNPCPDSLL